MSEWPEACPFCGKKDMVSAFPLISKKASRGYDRFSVGCRSCNAYMGGFNDEKEATRAWNKRNPRKGLKNCPLCAEAIKEEQRRTEIHYLNAELVHLTRRLKEVERGLEVLDKD